MSPHEFITSHNNAWPRMSSSHLIITRARKDALDEGRLSADEKILRPDGQLLTTKVCMVCR